MGFRTTALLTFCEWVGISKATHVAHLVFLRRSLHVLHWHHHFEYLVRQAEMSAKTVN